MRKILCALLLALAAATPMFADPPDPPDPPKEDVLRPRIAGGSDWFLQLDAGINFTLLSGNSAVRPRLRGEQEYSEYKSATGIGPLVGLTFGHYFSPMFGLSVRVDYDGRSASNSVTRGIDTCNLFDVNGQIVSSVPMAVNKDYTVKIDYLSFSLLGNLRFEKWLFFFGPTFSIPLSGSIKENAQILDDTVSCFYFFNTPDQTKSITGDNTDKDSINTRVSLKLGVGYDFEIAKNISLIPQVAFDLGFTDTYKTPVILTSRGESGLTTAQFFPAYNAAIRLNSLQATIGLRFNF
jgi:hypothetical protein